MEKKNAPYLCGGLFFLLLTQIKANKRSKRQIRDAGGHDNNNTDVLVELVQMFDPSFDKPEEGRTFDSETTAYKACRISSTTNLAFDDQSLIDGFNDFVRLDYVGALSDMYDFVNRRIGVDGHFTEDGLNNGQWLIQALLELIEGDTSIPDDKKCFYVLPSGKPVSKTELLMMDRYCLDSFLLGVWHYVLTERALDNEKGQDTYLAWNEKPGEESERAVWRLKPTVGRSYSKKVEYYRWDESEVSDSADEDDYESGEKNEEVDDAAADEIFEKEEDHEDSSEATKENDIAEEPDEIGDEVPDEDQGRDPVVNQTAIFNNYGNGPQFCHIGNYYDNRGNCDGQ